MTTWTRALSVGAPTEIDGAEHIIRGYVVAQVGQFKDDRGRFDLQSLNSIVTLGNAAPRGLKSRFGHPTLSDDGLGKFLGRAKTFRLDVDRVRADLHLSPTAAHTPAGDLRGYVEALAVEDPDSFSSSLVLQFEQDFETDAQGNRATDDEGHDLPAIWRPTVLHASDVVDTGAAVDGFLSSEGGTPLDLDKLPDAALREASSALDQIFASQPREVVAARLSAWIDRYLSTRYGTTPTTQPAAKPIPSLATLKNRLRLRLHR